MSTDSLRTCASARSPLTAGSLTAPASGVGDPLGAGDAAPVGAVVVARAVADATGVFVLDDEPPPQATARQAIAAVRASSGAGRVRWRVRSMVA
jgi:hypothetical protein